MKSFLVDTNILSAGSPQARGQLDELQHWMSQNSPRLFLPTIALAEVTAGIARARRVGAFRKAIALDAWLADTLRLYGGRILSLGEAEAEATGLLIDRARSIGHAPGFADLAIAGIAAARNLTLLTRNLRHFAPLGIAACDPYAALPN